MGIRPQANTDWTEFPNQWAMCIGRSGTLKSPAIMAALSPLERLAAKADEAHQKAMEEFQPKAKMAKLRYHPYYPVSALEEFYFWFRH